MVIDQSATTRERRFGIPIVPSPAKRDRRQITYVEENDMSLNFSSKLYLQIERADKTYGETNQEFPETFQH